jgi:hypothetical protein
VFLAQDWSLKSLFGRRIEQACPVSSASQIRVSIPQDRPHLFTPQPMRVDGSYAVFDVSGSEWLWLPPFQCSRAVTPHFLATDVDLRWHEETSFENRETPQGVPLFAIY